VRRLVGALLVVVEPITLAFAASSAIESLVDRGPASVAFLAARLAITGLGMAAGIRLWQRRPGGIVLARWSYGLQLAATVVAHATRLWPSTLAPGIAGPAFAMGVAWYSLWLGWSLRTADYADHAD
jgi:hypothetical protein